MLLPSPVQKVKEHKIAKERAKAKAKGKATEREKVRKDDLASGFLKEPLANSTLLELVPRDATVRIFILSSSKRCLDRSHTVISMTLLLFRQNQKQPSRRPETERKRIKSDKWPPVKF